MNNIKIKLDEIGAKLIQVKGGKHKVIYFLSKDGYYYSQYKKNLCKYNTSIIDRKLPENMFLNNMKKLCETMNLSFIKYICSGDNRSKSRIHYKCNVCNFIHNVRYGHLKDRHGCPNCVGQIKKEYGFIKDYFSKIDFTLLSKTYKNAHTYLKCFCNKHPNIIQKKTWNSIQNGRRCEMCFKENNKGENHASWKGGTTPLYNHLRSSLKYWFKKSIESCDNKCAVTGDKYQPKFEIHHLKSFNLIIKEILDQLNLKAKPVKYYSKKELYSIRKLSEQEHNKLLGVCLRPDIHDLFHSYYGFGDNTPEQFYEFKEKFIQNKLKPK